MRTIILSLALAAISLPYGGISFAGDLVHGCWNRPDCGKFCKLVCEKKKLSSVGYGSKCDSICIPGPSRQGCKHCKTTCCCQDDIKGCPPKIEFCWYDWFVCGCARPRTINVLTKYQAELEVCSYHWEVVDASCCDCVAKGDESPPIFKPAPTDAQLGEVIAVSESEWKELTSALALDQNEATSQVAQASATTEESAAASEKTPTSISIAERLGRLVK